MSIWTSKVTFGYIGPSEHRGTPDEPYLDNQPYLDYVVPSDGLYADGRPERMAQLPRGSWLGFSQSSACPSLVRVNADDEENQEIQMFLDWAQVEELHEGLGAMLNRRHKPE